MMKLPKQLKNPNFRFIKIGFDKRATEKGWNKDINYKYDDKEFQEYIKNAEYGYGITTGFGNLAVVDCDSSKFGKLVKEKLLPTFTVRTGGGGLHLYYIIKDLDKKHVMHDLSKDKKKEYINFFIDKNGKKQPAHLGEVQWQGQYVVGANSPYTNSKKGITIEDGISYDITDDIPITEITKNELLKVIKKYLKEFEKDEWKNEVGEYDISKVSEKIDIENSEITNGILRGVHPVHGSTNGKNFEIDFNKNIWHCYRDETGGDALNLIAVLEGILDCSKSKKGCLKGKKFRKVALIAKEKYGLEVNADILVNTELLDDYRVIRYNKFGIPMINPVNLAKLILEKEDLKLLIVNNEANGTYELYYYNENGYYDPEGKLQVRRYINKYLEHLSVERIKNEVCGWISDLPRQDRSTLEPDSKYINFKNGILNIETGQLEGHSSNKTFLNQIPWNWNPKAECPKILKFFNEVLDSKYIPLLQEIFGYTLYRKYIFAHLFIFYGSGRNGKGVTLNLLQKMLSIKNISSRPLGEITADRFAKADLYCAMANIAGEMHEDDLIRIDAIKELTGGNIQTAQKKNKDAFQFLNYAKLIFNTNVIPYTKLSDKNIAFYDRLCIIKFLNKFDSSNPKTDTHLFEKISTNEEIEGLIIWSIEGLRRLLKNDKFNIETDIDEIVEEYENSINPEINWITENFESDLTSKEIPFNEIYNKYVEYCTLYNIPIPLKQTFNLYCHKTFKNINPRCIKKTYIKKNKQRKSKRYTYFYGISWKDDN